MSRSNLKNAITDTEDSCSFCVAICLIRHKRQAFDVAAPLSAKVLSDEVNRYSQGDSMDIPVDADALSHGIAMFSFALKKLAFEVIEMQRAELYTTGFGHNKARCWCNYCLKFDSDYPANEWANVPQTAKEDYHTVLIDEFMNWERYY